MALDQQKKKSILFEHWRFSRSLDKKTKQNKAKQKNKQTNKQKQKQKTKTKQNKKTNKKQNKTKQKNKTNKHKNTFYCHVLSNLKHGYYGVVLNAPFHVNHSLDLTLWTLTVRSNYL